ncbi:hypothetical protein NUW54_g3597 [Trametes sanguinea]|uniref:Uncharacterized protein n=1 Tax=Trametes sanguinea TaxID=158606 RepID=A0ACC1Q098_9APHY|nr:hypothetical protein NUW54_g3597 [Trametes sanguinea]
MPSSRTVLPYALRQRYPPAIRQTVRARLYGYGSGRPQSVSVRMTHYRARAGTTHSYLAAEEFLDSALYVHDCDVTSQGGTFKLYFTRHRFLPPNPAVLSAHRRRIWHGQILAIRMNDSSHVDLRRGDLALIEKIISRFVEEVERRSRIPRTLLLGPLG